MFPYKWYCDKIISIALNCEFNIQIHKDIYDRDMKMYCNKYSATLKKSK